MLFHAIIKASDDESLNHRTSTEAFDEQDAREKLETLYGNGRVDKVWMDYEQSKLLPDSVVRQK